MNITDDAHRVTPVTQLRRDRQDYLLMHEGKTIQQFDDRWDSGARYAVAVVGAARQAGWREAARYFRLALRKIARSTDERTAIAAFTSPGYLFSIPRRWSVHRSGGAMRCALQLCAVINSFMFDWALRQKAAATINLFILEACPVCDLSAHAARFLAHGALRLSCNHAAYAPLWHEQLGTAGARRRRREVGRRSHRARRAGDCARRSTRSSRRPTGWPRRLRATSWTASPTSMFRPRRRFASRRSMRWRRRGSLRSAAPTIRTTTSRWSPRWRCRPIGAPRGQPGRSAAAGTAGAHCLPGVGLFV